MQLNAKNRYAVTAMLDLALHAETEPVPLRIIAERQKISLPYLEQLFAKLRKEGLVTSTRGPGGGYALARDSSRIAIANIFDAFQKAANVPDSDRAEDSYSVPTCLTDYLCCCLNEEIKKYFSAISLADLMKQQKTVLFQNIKVESYAGSSILHKHLRASLKM